MSDILEFDFGSQYNLQTFNLAVDYFKEGVRRPDQGYDFFDGREISSSEIHDTRLLRGLWSYVYQIIQYTSPKINCYIYPEFWDLVYWPPGMPMDPHIDNVEGLEQRHFSSVTYLNSDYEGGQTYFPDHNKVITPVQGKTVLYPSTHPHGVKEVTEGERYTFAVWFTTDPHFCKPN